MLAKSGGLLLAGRVAIRLLAFGRNVFVARILTPEDYGLAATFWITTGLLATITEFGFAQRLIQASDGDDDRVGAVAQTLFVLRGLLIGAVLFVSAGPVAELFKAPEATWAFRLLALLPIMSGFMHRDVDRLKRQLNFKPEVLTKLLPELVITILAVPIALATRDYSTFLYLALIQTALMVAMSQWMAERPFRMGWDREIAWRFLDFGWPLLINSLLLYGMMQGDRIILAGAYTKVDLGVYSVAIGLITAVIGLTTSSINPIVLPVMARVQDDRVRFEKYYGLHVNMMAAIAMSAGAGFVLLGPQAILLVYGPKYALATTVVGWLGISQSIRLLRMPASNAAMALGDTQNMMYANIFRQSGILLALIVAWRGMSLEWIAISGVIGELITLVATGLLLNRRHQIPFGQLGQTALFTVAVFFVSSAMARSGVLQDWPLAPLGCYVAIIGITAILYSICFPAFRQEFSRGMVALRHRFSAFTA